MSYKTPNKKAATCSSPVQITARLSVFYYLTSRNENYSWTRITYSIVKISIFLRLKIKKLFMVVRSCFLQLMSLSQHYYESFITGGKYSKHFLMHHSSFFQITFLNPLR